MGPLSNEDTSCSPNHIELCTNLHPNKGHLSIADSQMGRSGALYKEAPLYPQTHQWHRAGVRLLQ